MPAPSIARPDSRHYSDAQSRMITRLAQERDLPVAGATAVEAAIIARFEDILGNAPYGTDGHRFVSMREASAVIDWAQSKGRKPAAPVIAPNEFTAMLAELRALPKCKYIVTGEMGQRVHVEVSEYRSRVYLNVLIGAPGSWRRQRVSVATSRSLAAKVMSATYTDPISGRAVTGPEAAAVRFSREYTCCAACGSPLSDESQPGFRVGLGPVCVTRFGG